MSQRFNKLPSEIVFITDDYEAFCFNEACAVIMSKIDKGEEPIFEEVDKPEKHYINFTEFYEQYNS